ncbi:MAG: sodium-dependent transporter [Prevotellaceae bacterium]|nr:sodium-dependent transporter [Prevotellaceae bacterium]
MADEKQVWGSRVGLILAMAGNAVGLGNFLRFPVQAVQNGGGAFIIPYIVSFILLGLPLLLIEWSTGKYGGQFGHHSPPMIMQKLDSRWAWKYIGAIGIFSSIIISSYYCYIESWTLSYVFHSAVGTFNGMTEEEVSNFFSNYLDLSTTSSGLPYEAVVLFVFCLGLNVFLLGRGIKNGIEVVAKVCMPLLLVFGLFLVYKSFTLKAGIEGAYLDGTVGLNFMWTPHFDSLLNPKVWLSAAGQVFFTLSLGMGCIQTYASYMRKREDVTLNSMTAGFLNEFTEIVIGSAIIIPISIGYFGIDSVIELSRNGGLGLGFRTMPFLFEQWGGVLSAVAGVSFFGLLFLASITSTLALATPTVGFFSKSYGWSQKKSSGVFGMLILVLGILPVLFFSKGVFDQYDYWGGTIALFVFAMSEAILFSWVFGVDKGWKLIHYGADMNIPIFFKYVMKYVTPTMLVIIFVAALIKPKNDDWSLLSLKGWELDDTSIISELNHKSVGPNKAWFSKNHYAENTGLVEYLKTENGKTKMIIANMGEYKEYDFDGNLDVYVKEDDLVMIGTPIYGGRWMANNVFYIDMIRVVLLALIIGICVLIHFSAKRTSEEERCMNHDDMFK